MNGKEKAMLLSFLERFQPGTSLSEQDTSDLESLLTKAWPTISGADAGGMKVEKLSGRIENAAWNPPLITFDIERHGGTVLGSTRATLQGWTINTSDWTARVYEGKWRLKTPQQPALRMEPLVAEICDIIVNRSEDERVKWSGESCVRVIAGKTIPDIGPKQTVEGRRRRFRAKLKESLLALGWQEKGLYIFEKID